MLGNDKIKGYLSNKLTYNPTKTMDVDDADLRDQNPLMPQAFQSPTQSDRFSMSKITQHIPTISHRIPTTIPITPFAHLPSGSPYKRFKQPQTTEIPTHQTPGSQYLTDRRLIINPFARPSRRDQPPGGDDDGGGDDRKGNGNGGGGNGDPPGGGGNGPEGRGLGPATWDQLENTYQNIGVRKGLQKCNITISCQQNEDLINYGW